MFTLLKQVRERATKNENEKVYCQLLKEDLSLCVHEQTAHEQNAFLLLRNTDGHSSHFLIIFQKKQVVDQSIVLLIDSWGNNDIFLYLFAKTEVAIDKNCAIQ